MSESKLFMSFFSQSYFFLSETGIYYSFCEFFIQFFSLYFVQNQWKGVEENQCTYMVRI